MRDDPNEIISQLVDAWCERREIRPLACILSAWTFNNGLTDGWLQLHDDLKRGYAICQDLPTTEREKIKDAYIAIDVALRNH